MKTLLAIALLAAASITTGSAQVHVNGHYRGNGTYVEPYWRSSPNGTTSDNYSTTGYKY